MILKTDRHGPNRFKTYREIHETIIAQFIDQKFISLTTLEFRPYLSGFRLSGYAACLGQIVVSVDKFLNIIDGQGDNAFVQTYWYSYNASIQGNFNILRYDNQDEDYLRDGHLDEHHKHEFDWKTGRELPGSPSWIGEQRWPTLGEVFQEIEDWYWHNREDLPNSDAYPDLRSQRKMPSLEL